MSSGNPSFDTEVVKLLLQVAWADDTVEPAEREMIFGLGRSWLVPEAELKVLMERLEQGKPLPQPNLALLKTRPDDVLEAARALAATDGSMAAAEKEMIAQISELLGVKG